MFDDNILLQACSVVCVLISSIVFTLSFHPDIKNDPDAVAARIFMMVMFFGALRGAF